MTRLAASLSLLGLVASLPVAASTVTVSQNADAFTKAFCASDRSAEHIFVVPAVIFGEHESFVCPHGTHTLRMAEPTDDPGHVVLNVDPPAGVEDAFDCDAKADVGMSYVALNCLPANAESPDHPKN